MGTTWSEEAKSSSQQQVHSEFEGTTTQKYGNTVLNRPNNANNKSPILSRNASDNKPKEANSKLSISSTNKVLPKLPYNCEAIIKDAITPVNNSSIEKFYDQLYAGVYLSGKKMKYWVERNGNNCFALFASGLAITWGDNQHYWVLRNEETSDHGNITVAQLRNVCWLEVHGRLHTANLSPGVTYQAAYLIKIEPTSYGWEVPVNFRLTLPDGTKQVHQENLSEKPKGEWFRVPVGEFKSCPEMFGEIEVSLYEYEGGNWKKGLVIKGVTIEPKNY